MPEHPPEPTAPPAGRRSYDASGRRAAASERRARILDAAAELFVAEGWTSTTLARVAAAAGVSVELVSSAFGTKADLLVHALRHVSYRRHPDLRAAVEALDLPAEPDLGRRVAAVVELACVVLPGMAPMIPALHRAADQDASARAVMLAARERHSGTSLLIAELLAAGPVPPDAVDEIYAALLAETYLAFVADRGWSTERYAVWLGRTLTAAVQPDR